MSKQPPTDPKQNLNISDRASLENSQIGGNAGRDLNVNQIQGKVVNVTVYDRIHAPDGLSKQSDRTTKSFTRQEYNQRRILINRVKKFWITGVLERSLHTQTYLTLGLRDEYSAVKPRFSGVEEFPEQFKQTIAEGTEASDVFENMGMGKTLLILGEPGAGKTIILLKLAKSLIARYEEHPDEPIPVVFNLSSWTKKNQSIANWLVEELSKKYQVSNELSKTWINEQQLLLLLDGLDEVKSEYREACVKALNKFTQTHGSTEIVICSRRDDYFSLSERVFLQGAISIKSLNAKQIDHYFNTAGEKFEKLRLLVKQDTKLQTFITSPLILSIVTLAYQDTLEELWLQSNSITEKERLCFLFDSYIERMLKRKKLNFIYSDNQTKIWLIWLAKIINKTSKEVFLIENLQLDSFEHLIDRFAYCLGLLIIYFIIGFSVGKILLLQNSELIKGLLFGIPIFWLISQGYTVKTIEKIKWSWKKFFQTLGTYLLFSFFYISIGIAVMILFSFFGGDQSPSDYADEYSYVNETTVFAAVVFGFYILFLFLSIIFGIINSLIRGTTGMTIEKKSFPNQGILRSFRYSILFSFISLITTVVVAYFIHFPVVFSGSIWNVFWIYCWRRSFMY